MNRLLLGYSPDLDLFDDIRPSPRLAPAYRPLALASEDTETATELLEAIDRGALAGLLTNLLRRTAHAKGGTLDRPLEAELVALLERAARVSLPTLATPPSRAAGMPVSRFFGIELEGLSPEDQEFEGARRFVELVQCAAGHAAASPRRAPPAVAAWLAALRAARQCAPGWTDMLHTRVSTTGPSRPHFSRGVHHA